MEKMSEIAKDKITLEEVLTEYVNGEVCLGEILASLPARGLTIEEAFHLYIKAMHKVEEDEFLKISEGRLINLTKDN